MVRILNIGEYLWEIDLLQRAEIGGGDMEVEG